MHRQLIAAATVISLGACATPGTSPTTPVARVICSDGFAPLSFTPGADTLDPFFAKVIDWPARAARQCGSLTLTVRGLPDPGEDSLGARRAANVARALQGFGAPAPTFVPGDQDDQDNPSLEVHARP